MLSSVNILTYAYVKREHVVIETVLPISINKNMERVSLLITIIITAIEWYNKGGNNGHILPCI